MLLSRIKRTFNLSAKPDNTHVKPGKRARKLLLPAVYGHEAL